MTIDEAPHNIDICPDISNIESIHERIRNLFQELQVLAEHVGYIHDSEYQNDDNSDTSHINTLSLDKEGELVTSIDSISDTEHDVDIQDSTRVNTELTEDDKSGSNQIDTVEDSSVVITALGDEKTQKDINELDTPKLDSNNDSAHMRDKTDFVLEDNATENILPTSIVEEEKPSDDNKSSEEKQEIPIIPHHDLAIHRFEDDGGTIFTLDSVSNDSKEDTHLLGQGKVVHINDEVRYSLAPSEAPNSKTPPSRSLQLGTRQSVTDTEGVTKPKGALPKINKPTSKLPKNPGQSINQKLPPPILQLSKSKSSSHSGVRIYRQTTRTSMS